MKLSSARGLCKLAQKTGTIIWRLRRGGLSPKLQCGERANLITGIKGAKAYVIKVSTLPGDKLLVHTVLLPQALEVGEFLNEIEGVELIISLFKDEGNESNTRSGLRS